MIPAITHPLGKYWSQPSIDMMAIDEQHALMDRRTFDELAEYSCSTPSGVYDGKVWKRRVPYMDNPEGKYTWYLCWYGPSDDPNKCAIKIREILLI